MSDTPHADQGSTPTRWSRAWAYALAWLPPLCVMVWYLPQYAVLYRKLDERGELPGLTHSALAFVRLNQACYYLPAVVAFVGGVTVAEALLCALCRARQDRLGGWAWRAEVVCLGLLAWSLSL